MNIWVVIPAYNEENNIIALLARLKEKNIPVLVIDDGSIDRTYELASSHGSALVLRNEMNAGKGVSLRRAFSYLRINVPECEAVIVMDADNQHSPDEVDVFVRSLEQGSLFVQGNRMNNHRGMPFIRVLTNRFMSSIISRICRQSVPDSQCGYRAIHMDVLRRFSLDSARYEIDSELLIKASRAGFMIDSVPVSSIYRHEKSSINPVRDTVRFFRFLARLSLQPADSLGNGTTGRGAAE
jgi:glycosyltransferase involved in cell wall biosynthesis